ncbi:MAG: TonB-dependent receptor, partial [Sphingomonas sp.]
MNHTHIRASIRSGTSLAALALTAFGTQAMAQTAPIPPASTQPSATQPGDPQADAAAPATTPVQADATPEAGPEADIVVTGFRASLDSALNAKRRETAAIDSIVAEDIGKFPDSNLAESMQRI